MNLSITLLLGMRQKTQKVSHAKADSGTKTTTNNKSSPSSGKRSKRKGENPRAQEVVRAREAAPVPAVIMAAVTTTIPM